MPETKSYETVSANVAKVREQMKEAALRAGRDPEGVTLVAASTMDPELKGKLDDVDKKGAAKLVGKLIAERAVQAGIKTVVFDRGGYMYTGRVASVADGAREAGLEF